MSLLGPYEVETNDVSLAELIGRYSKIHEADEHKSSLSFRCRPRDSSSKDYSHRLLLFILPERANKFVRERIQLLEDAFQNQILTATFLQVLDDNARSVPFHDCQW